jgi:cell division protein FtsL
MQRQQQRYIKYRIKWFRFVAVALVVYFIYSLSGQQIQIQAIHRETEATRAQLEQANQLNADLLEERKLLHTTAYVEKLAREELGMAKPDEIPYLTGKK